MYLTVCEALFSHVIFMIYNLHENIYEYFNEGPTYLLGNTLLYYQRRLKVNFPHMASYHDPLYLT